MFIAIGGCVVFAAGAVGLWILARTARAPENLGASSGRLAACPSSPNCVSSQARRDSQRVAPLAFEGPARDAWDRAVEGVSRQAGTRIVRREQGYLHAEVRSRLFGFIDDVELLLAPEQKVIHVRSASRAGYSDLGVNRRRVERIRRAFSER